MPYKDNKKRRAARRRWLRNPANRQKMTEHNRRCYEANKQKIIARSAAWAKANPEKRKETRRRWVKANPGKNYSAQRRYRRASPEIYREATRRWVKANPDTARAANNRWRKANPEKCSAMSRRASALRVARLSPAYIRELLSTHRHLRAADIPDGLVLAKRQHLKIKRLLKTLENQP